MFPGRWACGGVATHMSVAFRLAVRLCLPCVDEGRWKRLWAVAKDLGRAPWLADLRRAANRDEDPSPSPDPDPEHEELEASEELDEEAEDLWCCCCGRCCVTKCMTTRRGMPLLLPALPFRPLDTPTPRFCLSSLHRLFVYFTYFFYVALFNVCGSRCSFDFLAAKMVHYHCYIGFFTHFQFLHG